MTTRYYLTPERVLRCSVCDIDWDEDDCQQVQPDGHLACPNENCGDLTLTEVPHAN